MKYLIISILTFSFLLLSLLIFTGCNVNDTVMEDRFIELNIHGMIINGETGKAMDNVLISLHKNNRDGVGENNSGDLRKIHIATGDSGLYRVEGLIRNCTTDKRAGRLKAETTDAAGRYLSASAEIKCTNKRQDINLTLRRHNIFHNLIIK